MGVPKIIKTDNRNGYYDETFQLFCPHWENDHKTDIPCDPPGQGILEHAHNSLKTQLLR